MDIRSLKIDLIHWLTELKDTRILEQLQSIKELQEYGSPLSKSHQNILDERIEQYEPSPEDVLDWKEVQREIEKDL